MPGIELSTTIVITFNDLLLTKQDRAYMVRCFYMEMQKMVMTELEIEFVCIVLLHRSQRAPAGC